jgi:hypothetical protein
MPTGENLAHFIQNGFQGSSAPVGTRILASHNRRSLCDSRSCPGHQKEGEYCPSGWFRCQHQRCAGRHGSREDAIRNRCIDGEFKCECLGCTGHAKPGDRCRAMFL